MPVLKLDGDASGAVKATSDVSASVDKIGRSFDVAAKEAQKLEQAAKRIVQENETAQERYNRKCEELAKLYERGKISVDDLHRATQRYLGEVKGAGDAHEHTFGGAALEKVVEMGAAYLSVEKAVELGSEALQVMSERAHEAGERTKEALTGVFQIVQASRSPEEFAANAAATQQLRGLGISSNQSEAIAGAMGKSGLSSHEREFMESALHDQRLSASQAPAFMENVRGFQEAFPKAGSFQDVSRQAMEASRYSMRFSPDEILALALKAKEGGTDLSSDQLLATIGQIGRTTPQAKKAASTAEKFLKEGGTFEGRSADEYAKELSRVQGAGSTQDVDYIAGNSQFRAARAAEEEESQRKLTEEYYKSEPERLGQAILEGRRNRAAKDGTVAEGSEWFSQKATKLQSWRSLIEAEADPSNRVYSQASRSGDAPFADVKPETAEAIKEYLARIHGESQKQTEIMERTDRQPPAPNGRQEK